MNEEKLKELLKLAWDAGSEECLDTYYGRDTETFQEWYTKQKLNIHGVMQAEGPEGADGAAVASEGQEKSVSAEVHDCTKYAKINCKCEGYCEYEERLAGRLPRQQLF